MPASAITRVSTSRPLLALKWGKAACISAGKPFGTGITGPATRIALHLRGDGWFRTYGQSVLCRPGEGTFVVADGPDGSCFLNLAMVVLVLDGSYADCDART